MLIEKELFYDKITEMWTLRLAYAMDGSECIIESDQYFTFDDKNEAVEFSNRFPCICEDGERC